MTKPAFPFEAQAALLRSALSPKGFFQSSRHPPFHFSPSESAADTRRAALLIGAALLTGAGVNLLAVIRMMAAGSGF